MNRRSTLRLFGLSAASVLLLSACASTPPKHLEEARATYAQAAEHSHAQRYAPTELQQAKQSLARAEQAYKNSANSPTAHTLAYLALRRAQQAMASAELNYMATTRKAQESELLARTDAARQHYQRRMVEHQRSAAATEQMNAQQLQQQRQQLQEALDQLDEQNLSQADTQALQTQYQDAMTRLDAEIERREHAEARLEDVTQQLASIAQVRQDGAGATIISLDSATLFENGKYDLLPIARQNLQRVAETLQMQPETTLTVAGYTSSTGAEDFNQTLSENRADAVKEYLVSRGIPEERIETVGYGEERPVASNDTSEGRAMNRRVEIILDTSEATGGGPDDAQEPAEEFYEGGPADSQEPSEEFYEGEPTGGGPADSQAPTDDFFDSSDERPLSPLPPVDQVLPEDDRVGEPATIDD